LWGCTIKLETKKFKITGGAERGRHIEYMVKPGRASLRRTQKKP